MVESCRSCGEMSDYKHTCVSTDLLLYNWVNPNSIPTHICIHDSQHLQRE